MIRNKKLLASCAKLASPSLIPFGHSVRFTSSLISSSIATALKSPVKANTENNTRHRFSTNLKYLGLVPLMFGMTVALCEEEKPASPLIKKEQPTAVYVFDTGVSVIPDPAKAHKGGEDAYFISDDKTVLGVADGVGGWARRGVDAGLYSRALMAGAKAACSDATIAKDPVKLMRKGYDHAKEIMGSSTCCIALMDDGILKTANLGDSGFMVVRKNAILYRSKEQQHSFNFPFQLGGKTSSSKDLPEHSNLETIKVESGDIIILGTDGLWDNLYDNQILHLVKSNQDPAQLASSISATASARAHVNTGRTPFSDGALAAKGVRREGGKVDDITVVVGRVRDTSKVDEDEAIIGGVFSKLWAKL